MKKNIFYIIAVLIVAATCFAGLRDRSSEIELYGEKTQPGDYISIPEVTAPTGNPATGYGRVYVSDNDIYFEDDLGVATSMIGAASGGVSNLDEAYDGGGSGAGRNIAVDQGAVLLTGTNAGNNVLEINNTGSGNIIDITNNGTGKDIDGTSSTWSFTKAGVLTLANGLTVDNGTDNILEINENSEELKVTFGTNLIDLSSTSGINQIDIFDGAATTLTKAANGAADDMTISVTGAQDSSLVLSSAGTAADALQLTASAGGIDITASGAAAGEDIDVSTSASVNISSTEDAANAIKLLTNGGTSETVVVTNTQGTSDAAIDINVTAGGFDLDAAKSVAIGSSEAAADAVQIAASAGGIDLTSAATFDIDITATGGKILGVASEAAADQFKIDATGVVAGNAINLETTDGGILLNADGAANGDIGINAADDLTLTAAGDMTLAVTGTVSAGGSAVTNVLRNSETVTAANVITAAECGKTFYLDADAEFQSTLPAMSTVSAGCEFRFVIADAASGANYTIVTGNSLENVINGLVSVDSTMVACAAEDTITMVDGNVEGDYVAFESDGTSWFITGEALTAAKLTCTQAD